MGAGSGERVEGGKKGGKGNWGWYIKWKNNFKLQKKNFHTGHTTVVSFSHLFLLKVNIPHFCF